MVEYRNPILWDGVPLYPAREAQAQEYWWAVKRMEVVS